MYWITIWPSVFINEIHYDNAGADQDEFVEIAGPAGLIYLVGHWFCIMETMVKNIIPLL